MTYQQFIKKLAKGPEALTAYILVSVLVLFQFIGMFCGRWIDLADWSVNIFLLVIVWILFAKACAKDKPIGKNIITCFFVWSICKLVVLGISVLMIGITAIYMFAKNSMCNDSLLLVSGMLLLLFGIAIYVFRILASIWFLKDISALKEKKQQVFCFRANWSGILIIVAALRGAGLLLNYIISVMASDDMLNVAIGYVGGTFNSYYGESSWFASQIHRTFSLGSNVMLTFIDGLYIAILIMVLLIYNKYKKSVGNKGQ